MLPARWIPIYFAFLIAMSPAAGRAAGDFANNGGGSAESNFVYAYQLLPVFIRNCLANSLCEMTGQERQLLQKIQAALPEEGSAQERLVFKTPAEEDFFLDGAIRVAKTGDRVGSRIFLNREMIYELRDGKPIAMDVPRAVSLLVHELGHHHGTADHAYLDLVGAKLRFFLMRSVISLNFDPRLFLTDDALRNIPYIPAFTVIYLNPEQRWQPDTRLLVNDSNNVHDLTDLILPSLEAFSEAERANGRVGLCDLNPREGVSLKGRVAGFDLLSPHWEQSYFYKPFGQRPLFNLRLGFVLHVVCKASLGLSEEQVWAPQGLRYELHLTFDKVGSQLIYRKQPYLNPRISQRDPFER